MQNQTEIFKLQVSISTNGSNVAQHFRTRNDRIRIYGMERQRRCSVRVPDDSLLKNTEQSFNNKSGFLRLHYDGYHVTSYGNKLLLPDLGVR